MSTPQLQGQSGSPLTVPWAEFIGRTGISPNGAMLKWGESDGTVTLDLNFGDVAASGTLQGVIEQLVGYAVRVPPAGGSPSGTIRRTLPIRHPVWPQLWCSSVSKVTFLGPDKKSVVPSQGFGPTMDWRICRCELHFVGRDYAVLADEELNAAWDGGEFNRFVSGPYVDYNLTGLQRQPGVGTGFMWGADAPGGFAGLYIKQGVTQFLPTFDVTYTWQLLPEGSLLDGFGFATNLNACYGKVNSLPFLGRPGGTLLMQKPKVEPVPAPFPLNTNVSLPQRLWKATIRMSFNPNGWNYVPFPLGGFHSIKTQDGNGLYQTIDFNQYLFVPL